MKIGNIEVYGVIYKITNTVNKKCYIGQTIQGFNKRYHSGGGSSKIKRVYNEHKYRMEHNESYNDHLLNSIEKYGFDAFEVIEVYDVAFSKKELDIKECMYIDLFNCLNNGYNHTKGGNGTIGYKHSDEYKAWKSVSMKGKSNPMYGKSPTDYMTEEQISEWKNNLSKAKKGKDFRKEKSQEELEEWNKKIGKAIIGENNGMYGKRGIDSPIAKSVICLTTKRIFHTVTEGAKYYNVSRQLVGKCCSGFKIVKNKKYKIHSAGKLSDGTKLVWRYLIWNHGKRYRVKEDD